VTRLRKMMLEELQRRNYSTITTRYYLRVVTEFAKYFGKPPDRLSLNELRSYQAYLLRERKLSSHTGPVIALLSSHRLPEYSKLPPAIADSAARSFHHGS
jgi:hypothetical protein